MTLARLPDLPLRGVRAAAEAFKWLIFLLEMLPPLRLPSRLLGETIACGRSPRVIGVSEELDADNEYPKSP
ncbi:MAG: hypothetical protein WDZ48_03335, partial [Pirellulales bacterium]